VAKFASFRQLDLSLLDAAYFIPAVSTVEESRRLRCPVSHFCYTEGGEQPGSAPWELRSEPRGAFFGATDADQSGADVLFRSLCLHGNLSYRWSGAIWQPSVPVGAHRCPSVLVGARRCPSVNSLRLPSTPVGVRRCPSVLVGARRCPSVNSRRLPSAPVGFRRCPSVPVGSRRRPSVNSRRLPSVSVGVRRCPSVPVGARRCPSVRVGSRRFSSPPVVARRLIPVGARRRPSVPVGAYCDFEALSSLLAPELGDKFGAKRADVRIGNETSLRAVEFSSEHCTESVTSQSLAVSIAVNRLHQKPM